MRRRQFIQSSAFAFGALTLAQKNLLSLFSIDPWKITMLRNEIGIFEEKGGTIAFMLGKKGIVVVDSQFPEQSQHLITELKNRSEQSISALINTHHHGDHTAGNISFKGIVGSVIAHENSKKNQETTAKQNKNEDKQLYPDHTYSESWTKGFSKEKISLQYYGAGHTNGDSFVHFQHNNIVHCGDLVFNRRHPFVDRTAGANIKSWIDVLEKAIKKFDRETIYVFGHSVNGYKVTGNSDDLSAFRDYLGALTNFVQGEIKAGKTKDEILKATIIPGAEEWKGDGIQRPLLAAYEELTGAA